MPTVLITPESMRHRETPCTDILRKAGFEVRFPKNESLGAGVLSNEEAIEEMSCADAVIAGIDNYSAPIIQACKSKLRVIARCGVGYDKVDVPVATQLNIAVTITPTANYEAVAEHALSLMFASAKFVVQGDKETRLGLWNRPLTEPIRGTTLGLVGLGRIGKALAVRGLALGMRVLAFETNPPADFLAQNPAVKLVSLDELYAESDFLSLHCPLNDNTRGLINKTSLAKMKKGSTLINTARGGLVVEADLLQALTSGHLRAAGLDVFEVEPTSAENPLFKLDNVVVTPHLAGIDWLSLQNMGIESANNIVNLYNNRWPEGAVVNHQLKSTWKW